MVNVWTKKPRQDIKILDWSSTSTAFFDATFSDATEARNPTPGVNDGIALVPPFLLGLEVWGYLATFLALAPGGVLRTSSHERPGAVQKLSGQRMECLAIILYWLHRWVTWLQFLALCLADQSLLLPTGLLFLQTVGFNVVNPTINQPQNHWKSVL